MTQNHSSPADLAIVNARVWTGADDNSPADALTIREGRITAVGRESELRERIGTKTRRIDADGRFVMPGFTDAHTHILESGLKLAQLDLRHVTTREEFTSAVALAVKEVKPGNWLLGGLWCMEGSQGSHSPRKEWIDAVTGDVPAVLARMDYHAVLANSEALKRADISRTGPADPVGGEIERDPATGEPTGLLKDTAAALVESLIPQPDKTERDDAILRAMKHANRMGITSIHDMSRPADYDNFLRIRESGNATLRVRSYLTQERWASFFDYAADFASDDWLTLAGFKGFMDGSLGSRTAYMFEPYSDARPDSKNPSGMLMPDTRPPEDLLEQMLAADRLGFQMAIHAIGDRANSMLLDLYAAVAAQNGPRPRRHRIEHAQHLAQKDIARFAELGLAVSMQPAHKADDGRWAVRALGEQRCRTSFAFRSLLDAGAQLSFGTDWPVVPIDPFATISAAVTARTLDGRIWVPEQSISVTEALKAYTVGGAWAGCSEDRLGTLEAGKLADIVVLDEDPREIAPDRLHLLKVAYTLVGGRVVFNAMAD